MNIYKFFIFVLCITVISGCKSRQSAKAPADQQASVKSILSGDFTISGAYALYPLTQKWADDFTKIHPGVKIEISETGTGQGIIDLPDKKVHKAMVSRPLTEEKEAGIWIIPFAKDGVGAIVNQTNPYLRKILKQGLSPDEFQRIFAGDKPALWGELLKYVLSDGQVSVKESGLCELNNVYMRSAQESLQ